MPASRSSLLKRGDLRYDVDTGHYNVCAEGVDGGACHLSPHVNGGLRIAQAFQLTRELAIGAINAEPHGEVACQDKIVVKLGVRRVADDGSLPAFDRVGLEEGSLWALGPQARHEKLATAVVEHVAGERPPEVGVVPRLFLVAQAFDFGLDLGFGTFHTNLASPFGLQG